MNLVYHRRNIPGLSWLSEIKKGSLDVDIYCGKDVECCDTFFVSGVWAGEFIAGDFSKSIFSCCSGAKVYKNYIQFCTPSHMQEQLFSVQLNNCIYISNSLAFILEHTGLDLDENYYRYEEDLCQGLFGSKKAKKYTTLKNSVVLSLYRYCNIDIDNNLCVQERAKPIISFNSFADYRHDVVSILSAVKTNAVSEYRNHKYGMISTISRGYDATTTSALARIVGCEDVLTFNSPEKYTSDCGTEIAKILEYKNIYELDANTYKYFGEFLEAECCSTGDMGSEIVFCAFDNLTSGKLLFMGARGDSLWERLHENVNPDLDFSAGNTYSQSSLTPYEHFNATNTIVINVPLIGASAWPDIATISNSAEMKYWSVRDNYDRPICRRIVEELGVSRNDFGQVKAGAGVSLHFNTLSSLKYKISNKSYESLIEFSKTIRRSRWKKFLYTLKFYSKEYPVFFNYIFSRFRLPLRFNDTKCGKMSSPISSLLILWSISLMRKRYKI